LNDIYTGRSSAIAALHCVALARTNTVIKDL